ncbi:MAG: polysaccharide deacetylase family protein [Bacteroidales bacterium]|jgi:hypothetical protein|nr:polysaccharide deacetylase family protein [Bacteroidales bacterium]
MNSLSCVEYILRFLLGDVADVDKYLSLIGYLSDNQQFCNYKIIIQPCGFFEDDNYGKMEPQLPLQTIENVPLLFGESKISQSDNLLIINADIVASSYFLLSRYEEYIHPQKRDEHGRFLGQYSLPYRVGFLQRPIVEEYGKLLRQWLRAVGVNIPEPTAQLQKAYLTTDIDIPSIGRTWRGLAKGLLNPKTAQKAVKNYLSPINTNPAFTFPWLSEQRNKLINSNLCFSTEMFCFFKTGGKTKQDKPHYDIFSADLQYILNFCHKNDINIGLHASYEAGIYPQKIGAEKLLLEKATGEKITANRHHFLSCREPKDLQVLENEGITDDFTMGYADMAGFRLGTCRAVHYIHPATKSVHSLILHPLTVMDCTLDRYMNLSLEDAYELCTTLIRQSAQNHGEITLLWHNHYHLEIYSSWQKTLYEKIIAFLRENL